MCIYVYVHIYIYDYNSDLGIVDLYTQTWMINHWALKSVEGCKGSTPKKTL